MAMLKDKLGDLARHRHPCDDWREKEPSDPAKRKHKGKAHPREPSPGHSGISKWAIPKPASANDRIRERGAIRPVQASCDYPQFRSGVRVFEKFAYVRSPNVQRLFTLREELVPLIDGRHP